LDTTRSGRPQENWCSEGERSLHCRA
jgi:hypothetical protein